MGTVIPMLNAPLILDPRAPYDIAQEFVRRNYNLGQVQTLHHHNGAFYAWTGTHYPEKDGSTLRAELYAFLNDAVRSAKVPFNPTCARVNEVLDCLKAVVHLDLSHSAPTWLCDAPFPANEILSCKNGLLHLPSGQLLPPTPTFFAHNALNFEFDPHAPQPMNWTQFLTSLWSDDAEAIATLQEMFGLCLTGETRYQKAFMLIGPRRSGKGTIGRVLTTLIGAENVVAPTLHSLAEPFGPAALIGKRVACISDARLGGQANQDRIVERLLSITGEDYQLIDRKYKDHWKGRLPVRFVVLSNELPKFDESSSALAGRFIIIPLTRSFYGREDLLLFEKILTEFPGILNWSIMGWTRLSQRGYFVQPRTGIELANEFENLASPIIAFVKDRCVVSPERSVECKVLYDRWRGWNLSNGTSKVPPINLFSRGLRAAYPQIRVSQPRRPGSRDRVFEGIDLQPN